MKKLYILSLFLVVALALSALPLRILHTNDSHAAYQAGWDGKGGYLALEYHLEAARVEGIPTLYLDAGDMQIGSIFSSLEYKGLRGGAILEVFERLSLDAATLGNHEFDISYAHAKTLVERAGFPFLSANLLEKDGSSFGRAPYMLFKKGGLKVGVIGLTIESLPLRVKSENVQDLNILPYTEALNRILPELKGKCDLIILLTHNGLDEDIELAKVLDDSIPLIIGGHSHIATHEPQVVNGKYILSTGSHLQNLGIIDLDIEGGKIKELNSRLVPLTAPPTDYPSKLQGFMQETIGEMERALAKPAGILPFAFEVNKYQETAGSRWVAEALLKEYPQQDLAFINNGGLRKNLPAGELSLRTLHEYIPFGNTVAFFQCKGSDLYKALELNRQLAIEKPYDIMSSSLGNWMGTGDLQIAGKKIDKDRLYKVVTHDYILSQWEKYLDFEPQAGYDSGELFLDAIIRQVQREFPIER
ncbi:MAG: bifunctional UDP-sugar hydrolase/5'-nucleotidase [Candidatus Cloacimonetes bacterium]|nr:bifunctional UDP-sugar hydrolase/5'-nucleotidase [Candidatus Cloacimonadota bacterium]